MKIRYGYIYIDIKFDAGRKGTLMQINRYHKKKTVQVVICELSPPFEYYGEMSKYREIGNSKINKRSAFNKPTFLEMCLSYVYCLQFLFDVC